MIPLKEIVQLTQFRQSKDMNKESAKDFVRDLEKEGFTTCIEELGSDKIRVTWF